MWRMALSAGVALGAALAVPPTALGQVDASDPNAPRVTVYDTAAAAERLLTGPGGIQCSENPFRQMPGHGAAYCTDDDQDLGPGVGGDFRNGDGVANAGLHRAMAKIDGRELQALATAEEIAHRIKREIDEPSELAASGQVGIDEIGNHFRDPKTPVTRQAFYCHGTKVGTFPVQHRVICGRNGWRLVKSTIQPEPPPPGSPAHEFGSAMEMLARTPHPDGGNYAERVHAYVAPALVTSVAVGRGPHFTQDRTGKVPIRGGWQGVARGLALAGGVHLQMYDGRRRPVSSLVWQRAAHRFGGYLTRFGGTRDRVHFVITGIDRPPEGAECGGLGNMACQVRLAASGVNSRYLANGPTLHRLGGQVREFLRAYRAVATARPGLHEAGLLDALHGIPRMSGYELAALDTPEQVADRIRSEIDYPRDPASGGRIAIEMGTVFRDPMTAVARRVLRCGGRTVGRFPTAFRLACNRGKGKVVRRVIPPAQPPEDSTGQVFSDAMALLAVMPHAEGGTYADRVHAYMAPAFVSSMAIGRGRHFTQGPRGHVPVRRGWIGVARGLALAGGVHLEMSRGRQNPLAVQVWERGPARVARYLRRYGGRSDRVHLMISRATAKPAGSRRICENDTPMRCQVKLARTGPNKRFFRNGLTLFDLGAQTGQFLAAYRAFAPAA